ncbi:MAG TPA: MOSC N-terminal beta barrel domain-containing protein [Patescibacteria group bacterium]
MAITVSGLYFAPVKSCGWLPLERAEIVSTGIKYDREWMFVDERGMFVAQRQNSGKGVEVKSLCQIQPRFEGSKLLLEAPQMNTLAIPVDSYEGTLCQVQVWADKVRAVDAGSAAADWVSAFINRERKGSFRLVRIWPYSCRNTVAGYGRLAFHDGYPFLILSQASVDDLNRRMAASLPVNRFRPNILLAGCEPYEEDHMAAIEIGGRSVGKMSIAGMHFTGATLCARCLITTTDQKTGSRAKEPLLTLSKYRPRNQDGYVFARNFNHRNMGLISVGEEVRVVRSDNYA